MTLLEDGRYSPSEAARLANLPVSTARRWLRRGPATPETASFLDLVELVMVREIRRSTGLNARSIRSHLSEAERLLGTSHALARRRFLADGKHLFVGLSEGGPFVELGTNGQVQLEKILVDRAKTLDFSEDLACRWFPMGRDRGVVIDPAVGWGSPVVAGTRVLTRTLAGAVRAEDGDFEKVAAQYELSPNEVRAAVVFEGLLAA